jgi:meiotically up-regulated gene 157 (Mug157) protein
MPSNIIPNSENAVVDIRKLRDYCLNQNHDDGKHKARLFVSSLGMTANDAEELQQILLEVVKTHEARLERRDEFGQRYTLDFTVEWQNQSATLHSGWIIEHNSEIPRLTTCYPL